MRGNNGWRADKLADQIESLRRSLAELERGLRAGAGGSRARAISSWTAGVVEAHPKIAATLAFAFG